MFCLQYRPLEITAAAKLGDSTAMIIVEMHRMSGMRSTTQHSSCCSFLSSAFFAITASRSVGMGSPS